MAGTSQAGLPRARGATVVNVCQEARKCFSSKEVEMAGRKIDNRQKKVVTPKREYGKDRGHFRRQKQAERGQRGGVPKR